MATRLQNDPPGLGTGESCGEQERTQLRRGSRKRWSRLLLLAATVSCVAAPTTGCTMARGLGKSLSHSEFLDEFMVDYRNSAWSARAWLCRQQRFANHPALSDFEAGFRQGYEDIASGASGCVPAVCPRAYWGWQYQAADGQKRMNAWFEGYPLGVQAAEEDGIGNWSHVATAFAGAAPCTDCPTGAAFAVPPKPSGEVLIPGVEQVETLPLPDAVYPESIPAPLLDSTTAPQLDLDGQIVPDVFEN